MAATTSHDDLLQQLCDNLAQRCRVRNGTRLLVAVSGGADSVALLRLLVSAKPQLRLHLEVAHFDHRLRPQSTADADFVRQLGSQLGLQVHVGSWNTPSQGEDAARKARLAFLEQTARSVRCGAIALGHHLDDQIETVLMRLARGSGPKGLLGMAWRRHAEVDLVRPLLDCRRARLIAFLQDIGQTWCEDDSNREDQYQRNRVRQRVLPALEEALGPHWREHWSASIDDQRRQWDWVESQSAALLERARRKSHPARPDQRLESCTLQPLKEAPEPLLRVTLQRWLESAGAQDLRRSHILEATELIQNGQTGQALQLPGHCRLHHERQRITLEMSQGHSDEISESETTKPTSFTLETGQVGPAAAARIVQAQKSLRTSPSSEPREAPSTLPDVMEALVCSDQVGSRLTVRTSRPGERVQLLGAPGQRRVARILQDHRVPLRLRGTWPVVADGEGIVWIPGAGIAERCRLGPASQRAMRLRLSPER